MSVKSGEGSSVFTDRFSLDRHSLMVSARASLERVTPREIHRLFEHHRHPDLPTDLD